MTYERERPYTAPPYSFSGGSLCISEWR